MCPRLQKKYTDSNARKNIDNVNDLADYYGDLEIQEKKEDNEDNRAQGQKVKRKSESQSKERNRSQRSNENHYMERNHGNSDHREGGTTVVTPEADPAMQLPWARKSRQKQKHQCIQTRWMQTRQSNQGKQQQLPRQIQYPLP